MKKIIFALLIVMQCSITFGQIKSADLVAAGLTCSMCSKSIFKALSKLPYVEKIDVDIDKSAFKVTFKKNAEVEIDGLKTAVENAGFSIASLQIVANFERSDVFNDAHIPFGKSTLHFVKVDKQTIAGEQRLTIVDHNFLPEANYNQYKSATAMKCIETGYMGSCCPNATAAKQRVYHVTL
jgi:copper chaperone CopZ